jgi:uncharacterized protein YbjT (DUF2867 family)
MRLLLLGCSGFVGRELVPLLLELGHELTLVSRQLQPTPPAGPATASSWPSPRPMGL